MCSLAPRAASPGFGASATASAFLDRRRGVAALALASSSEGKTGGEPMRRAWAAEVSPAAPAQKRGRHDGGGSDVASSALRIRMDAELVALHGLLKKARLLLPTASSAEKKCAPAPRRSEAPVVKPSAAKSATSSSQPKAATAAAAAYHRNQITPPATKNSSKQQERPVQRVAATIAPEIANNKQRPAEAPGEAKQQQQQCPVQRVEAKTEAPKKQRLEEIAHAREREEFRQMLLEMEKSALPDETIYPEDLEELGLPFEFLATRTWKQARLKDHDKKLEFVGA